MASRAAEPTRGFLRDAGMLLRGLSDPAVPWRVKILTALIIAYVLSPVDLIPDFIPVLGLLDEVVLVPLAVRWVSGMMPEAVRSRYAAAAPGSDQLRPWIRAGAVLVAAMWAAFIAAVIVLFRQL